MWNKKESYFVLIYVNLFCCAEIKSYCVEYQQLCRCCPWTYKSTPSGTRFPSLSYFPSLYQEFQDILLLFFLRNFILLYFICLFSWVFCLFILQDILFVYVVDCFICLYFKTFYILEYFICLCCRIFYLFIFQDIIFL